MKMKTMYQNLWDEAKTVLKEKIIAEMPILKDCKKVFHLNMMEKEEQIDERK